MGDSNLIETPKTFWETTYRQNINKMIGVGCRYTVNRQIAEDLAHDAFMIAYEKVSSFEGKGPFEAWLRRIVVNRCLQYIREQHKKKYLDDWLQNDIHTMEIDEKNIEKTPADFTEEELLQVINQLPEHHKLVFNLYVIDKFTHAEIGKELSISEGTSKSHLARARKKIKDLLHEKSGIEKKQKKKAAFFFLFLKVDSLYQKQFENFELPNQQNFSFDSYTNPSATVPTVNPSVPLLGKLSTIALASMVTAIIIVPFIFLQKNKREKIISEKINSSKIYPADTATISKNNIMYDDNKVVNKKSDNMKNVNAVGALLLAGTTLAMPVKGQIPVKVEKTVAVQVETEPKPAINIQADAKPVVNATAMVVSPLNVSIGTSPAIIVTPNVDITGTFYGEKLRWSAENNELYFDGKSVVTFGPNNFVSNGTASFLGKVYYLVIDGKPVKLEGKTKKDIRLSEKKYNLTQLSTESAIKKYGEDGKKGAIEISLAE